MKDNIFDKMDRNERVTQDEKNRAICGLEVIKADFLKNRMEPSAQRAQCSIDRIVEYVAKKPKLRKKEEILKDVELVQTIIFKYRMARNYNAEAKMKFLRDELEKEFEQALLGVIYSTEKLRTEEVFTREQAVYQGFQEIML